MTSSFPRRAFLASAVIALSACNRGEADPGVIEGTGTLELVEADIGPSVASRVTVVRVEEGSMVKAGDTLAILTLPTLGAQLEQQSARTRSASAQLRQLERGTRTEDIRAAKSELDAAESNAVKTANDLERGRVLARDSMISAQEFDVVVAAARNATARREAARATYDRARNGARIEDIEAARAEVAGASAAERVVRATASDLVLIAPFEGVITSRNAEPGEVLAPGQSVVTVGRSSKPWVRVYLGQGAIARVRVGQRAIGKLDDYPDKSFEGRVVAINRSAEFTPRVALTEQERADMLFGVRVEFDDTDGMLKGGLPITVRLQSPLIAGERP